MIKKWKYHGTKRKNSVNEILGGYVSNSVHDSFSIGIFDIQVDLFKINIGFIDYKYILELVYKHQASFAFDEFNKLFSKRMQTVKGDIISIRLVDRVISLHEEALEEIIEKYGNGLLKAIQEFYNYAVKNELFNKRDLKKSKLIKNKK